MSYSLLIVIKLVGFKIIIIERFYCIIVVFVIRFCLTNWILQEKLLITSMIWWNDHVVWNIMTLFTFMNKSYRFPKTCPKKKKILILCISKEFVWPFIILSKIRVSLILFSYYYKILLKKIEIKKFTKNIVTNIFFNKF